MDGGYEYKRTTKQHPRDLANALENRTIKEIEHTIHCSSKWPAGVKEGSIGFKHQVINDFMLSHCYLGVWVSDRATNSPAQIMSFTGSEPLNMISVNPAGSILAYNTVGSRNFINLKFLKKCVDNLSYVEIVGSSRIQLGDVCEELSFLEDERLFAKCWRSVITCSIEGEAASCVRLPNERLLVPMVAPLVSE